MNKDRIEGKAKDIAGRVERQVGEWTGDPEKQIKGAAKQVEGKLQNAVGKVEDAAKNTAKTPSKPPQGISDTSDSEDEVPRSRR